LFLPARALQATLELHNRVVGLYRKTAVNFHYEFNIRHLASVFRGLLMSHHDSVTTASRMGALWAHEAERVYGDRLVGEKDSRRFQVPTNSFYQ
jgi:dynein heavy chain